MELILKKIKPIIDLILEIIFPLKCFNCSKGGEILCPDCLKNLPYAERELDSQIFTVFDYQNQTMKKIIWGLKYYHYKHLGIKLGQILYENLIEETSEIKEYIGSKKIIIIPVPISKKKFLFRGYNQAEAIALGFIGQGGKENFVLRKDIIIKKVENTPQARIKERKRRLANIKGVFDIRKEKEVCGQTIFVIDDVTTTGGTINEIIKILKKAKARKVIGLAIAH